MQNECPYTIVNADCIPHMLEAMEPQSMDLAVFSPPFPDVFAYGPDLADIGNSENVNEDARLHLTFFYSALLRVMKPGRVVAVHVTQIHKRKRDGEVGVYDFRGMNIKIAERAGFTYDYDWCIRRNPQAQAIRTRKWELKFQGLETDRTISRGAMPDYILKFRAPGDNAVPVNNTGEVSRNDWIEWAEPVWHVNETETLNVRGNKREASTKAEGDIKHVCPLQLEPIRRLVKLYSLPGETVFSPFAGVGSEIVTAVRLGRKGYGIELKAEYAAAMKVKLAQAAREAAIAQRDLFSSLEPAPVGIEEAPE